MTVPAGAAVDRCIREAVDRGVVPGAVALVAEGAERIHLSVAGDAQSVPDRIPLTADTVFDLASLTKPLVTAALALLLERDLDLPPDRTVGSLLPELDGLDHASITLRHLLSHSAGLPAWRPLFLGAEGAAGYLRGLRDEPLAGPPGQVVLYSDPGYMAVGEMVARASGASLESLYRELLAEPLGIDAGFNPGPELAARCAATEDGERYERELTGPEANSHSRWREGLIRGQVHDHHAWVAGGVLGSAGLFAHVFDLHRLALEHLGEGKGILPPRVLERMRARQSPRDEEAWSEGFALNLEGRGSCGPALPESAFGHTGFTGTSLWIDPDRRRIYVLLTNRVHPRVGPREEMAAFRREFHRVAAEA